MKMDIIFGLGTIDDESETFNAILTVLIGVMAGIDDADKSINEIMNSQFTKQLSKITMGKILDKTSVHIAKVIGTNLIKRSVLKPLTKILPFFGGLVSGGVTLLSFKPMCNKLKNKLYDTVENAKGRGGIILV
ncbi:hypothetical protein FACS189494_11530 [Spirochaetia bacterium]|nr:hypothetical protein FACS189494_11530 [Spirochaetia bacterium]